MASDSQIPARGARPARWTFRPAVLGAVRHGVLLALLLALVAAVAAVTASAARARVATLVVSRVTVTGSQITVAGRVSLPPGALARGHRAQVLLTLSSGAGHAERFTAKIAAHDRFKAVHTTRLSGTLSLALYVQIAGRTTGRRLLRSVHVASPGTGSTSTGPSGPATTTPAGSGGSTGSGTPAAPACPSGGATVLNGTFRIQTGAEVAGAIAGSWFEMFIPGGSSPLVNGNSPLVNQDYTPLSAGTDGGLQTFGYEVAPSPAFDGVKEGKEVGNALANALIQPQDFFGYNFSVVTEPVDRQAKTADPLPNILDTGGHLTGQVTAWVVGWNGQWFNQGSPKPDGTLPSGTTALSGTCDAATGHYVLEWKSLIVGGPFNSFLGSWHLEGTFVPAG
jgi:hypothetical protein